MDGIEQRHLLLAKPESNSNCTLCLGKRPLVITLFSNNKDTRLVTACQILKPGDLLAFLTTTNF